MTVRSRVLEIWRILWTDPLRLVEVLSGLFLVALRGGLILGAPSLVLVNYEVAQILRDVNLDETTWGTYLMICGLLQIRYAGTPYATQRAVVAFLTLGGFALMIAAFWISDGFWGVPLSLYCMATLYTFLLGRILADRKDEMDAERQRHV